MIPLVKFEPWRDISQYAGVYVDALTDTPPPGRLPIDGSLVKIATFPKLFAKIGHLYTSGTVAGNGTEGDSFRLPLTSGRFMKPRDDGSLPGALTEDRASDHTHTVTSDAAAHGSHSVGPVGAGGGSFYFTHNYEPKPDEISLRGTYSTSYYTTGSSGDHNHTFSLANNVGAETRPYSMKLPGYIVTGETSSICVALIYAADWGVQPGYNEIIAAKTGLEVAFAKENIHTYRLRYPEAAAGKPTVDTAHVELCKQLKKLRSMYADVWIIGIGVGAHLAAMAMTVEERVWVATKFAAINGLFNPSGAMNASLTPSLTQYLGGTTQALKDKATPIAPYYPIKCWHGANNTVIPASQSQAFTPNTVIVPDLVHNANLINAGLFNDVLAFFRSEV